MTSIAEHPELEDLRAALPGRVITPGDHGYDAARAVFPGDLDPPRRDRSAARRRGGRAGGLDRRPDGHRAVGAGGGHSMAGHGVAEDALVVDLRRMLTLELDPRGGAAWAQTGLTAGEYTAAAGEHGLATGFGDAGSVGIGGITLGGGVGFLSRAHGLTIDNLLAAEIVTADGQIREVDADRDPDLFWAPRGGGGNFGVATRLRLRLRELPEVLGGMRSRTWCGRWATPRCSSRYPTITTLPP